MERAELKSLEVKYAVDEEGPPILILDWVKFDGSMLGRNIFPLWLVTDYVRSWSAGERWGLADDESLLAPMGVTWRGYEKSHIDAPRFAVPVHKALTRAVTWARELQYRPSDEPREDKLVIALFQWDAELRDVIAWEWGDGVKERMQKDLPAPDPSKPYLLTFDRFVAMMRGWAANHGEPTTITVSFDDYRAPESEDNGDPRDYYFHVRRDDGRHVINGAMIYGADGVYSMHT